MDDLLRAEAHFYQIKPLIDVMSQRLQHAREQMQEQIKKRNEEWERTLYGYMPNTKLGSALR